jgi:hypothetical protein
MAWYMGATGAPVEVPSRIRMSASLIWRIPMMMDAIISRLVVTG